jgi:hypothetical protein
MDVPLIRVAFVRTKVYEKHSTNMKLKLFRNFLKITTEHFIVQVTLSLLHRAVRTC